MIARRAWREASGREPGCVSSVASASLVSVAMLLVASLSGQNRARADDVADFYRGKRITAFIGSSTGDGTDLYGRLVASFIGRHIPGNPQIVAQNMPGANGLVGANYLYNVAPKDGSAIGTFGRYVVFEALWNNKAARFVPEKFNWIGNVQTDISTCVTWHTTGVDTLSAFMTRELKMGATSDSHVNILNRVFGAKLRAIKGYPGGNEITIALERGEVEGRCNWSWSAIMSSRPDWVRDRKINFLIQFSHKKVPELAHVPLVGELAKTDDQRQILDLILLSQDLAHVIVMPPEVPAERVAALRRAFTLTMQDPDFLAAAAARNVPVEPTSGQEIQELVTAMSKTPPDVVETFYDAVATKR